MNQIPTRSRHFLFVTLLATLALAPAAFGQTPPFSKAFSPSTIGPGSGSTLTFTIVAPSPARDADFIDNLPAAVTIATPANASTDCGGVLSAPAGGSTIELTDGEVAGSCTVTVDVTSSTPGTHTNTSGDLFLDGSSFGTASADLTVVTDRPGFSKSFSPGSVFFGDRSTLSFTIDNTLNTSGAVNLSFTDNLPSGMEIVSPSTAATTCTGGVLTAPGGGTTVSYTFAFAGDAGVGATASCTVTVEVVALTTGVGGVISNTSGELTSAATAGGTTRSSGTAGAILLVTVEEISLTKSFTDDPVAPGGTVTLEFTVRNLDRTSPATGISFTDDLAPVLSGLVLTGSSSDCGGTLSGPTLLTFTGGSLAPEGVCTVSATLQVPSGATPGSYDNITSDVTADIGGAVTGDPATDILVVEPAPSLTKTFIGDPVAAGGSIVLEFTITNTSPTLAATDITFEDVFVEELPTASVIPADDFCGLGSTASYTPLSNPPPPSSTTPAKLVVSGASLAADDSCTFSLTLDVEPNPATGTFPNTTSEITATVGGVTYTGNGASDSFVLVTAPALTKTFLDDPVAPGSTVALEFFLEHDENAPGDATDIAFSDDLTAALAGLTAAGLPVSDVCGSGSEITGTTNLSFTGGTLGPGESCVFVITLDVPSNAPAGFHVNATSGVTATVLGVTTSDAPATDGLVIAGLELSKEFTDDPVIPGGTVTLSFTIVNTSPVSDATDITFDDDLEDALLNLAAISLPPGEPCGTGSSLLSLNGGELLRLAGGNLLVGQSCTFDVTVQVPAGADAGVYTNSTNDFTATIEGSTTPFDNASDDLVVIDFLAFTKEFTDDPVAPGGTVNLRFTLSNLTDEDMTGLAFSDDLDAALQGLAATGPPSSACGGTAFGIDTISFFGGSLLAGTSCTLDVAVSVPSTVPIGTTVINVTSFVTGSVGGTPFNADPATDELRIDALVFSKAFGGSAVAGGTVELTFTLENPTGEIETDLGFTDNLGDVVAGLEATGLPQSDVCGTGSVVAGTSVIVLTGATLMPTGSCTITVTLAVPADAASGSYDNTTSDLIQNGVLVAPPATATLSVATEADLSIIKDAPATANELDLLTYTMTVSNAGPSDAQAVVVTDTLPAGVTPLTTATSGCAEGTFALPDCTLGTIAVGGSASYTILVSVNAGTNGVITNTATVAADTFDPDLGNNSASADTEVGFVDDDGDGVSNGLDVCPGTVIDPENGEPNVPEIRLGTNRWALIDGDGNFDTTLPNGNGPGESFTIEETGGCSCEQIIVELGLGKGHRKFGCSLGAMRNWRDIIDLEFNSTFVDGFESGDTQMWTSPN